MKKVIIFVMILVLMFTLCGCNRSLGFGNFNFTKVHIDTHHYSGCLTVEKWYENNSGTGIEVKTKEAGALFLSEGTYFLIKDVCPFCTHPTEKGGVE